MVALYISIAVGRRAGQRDQTAERSAWQFRIGRCNGRGLGIWGRLRRVARPFRHGQPFRDEADRACAALEGLELPQLDLRAFAGGEVLEAPELAEWQLVEDLDARARYRADRIQGRDVNVACSFRRALDGTSDPRNRPPPGSKCAAPPVQTVLVTRKFASVVVA